MRVIFLSAWDKYGVGDNDFLERTLAKRLIEKNIVRPFSHIEKAKEEATIKDTISIKKKEKFLKKKKIETTSMRRA